MLCLEDILCYIEEMIEFILCIITESIISCALIVGILMGTMMYLKMQYGLGQSLDYGIPVLNMNTECTGPMPTSTGTSGPPMNQHITDVPFLPDHKVPEGNSFLLSIFK